MSRAPLTLGTAGHIDHGKTALVRALTGVDTDRLPQERERGISIELGYAALDLEDGRRLSVVDVPGHERFVRTMVAGATGIDLYLMTIAADDGVMPQTREHARVLAGLGVATGVVAVTKADLADPAPASAEARALLPEADVVTTSARTGAGVDALRGALGRAADGLGGRPADAGAARLHVDRVFSVHGAGTVVTGTLWSGAVGAGDTLTLLPAGRPVRVRGVQVHDRPVERAAAGQRVAVNLASVRARDVARGDVLAGQLSSAAPTYRVDVAVDADAGARLRDAGPSAPRVQVHHGTREAPARTVPLGDGIWQLRLEAPLVAAAGDRVIVRAIAPPDTLGGAVVLDAAPARHGASQEVRARLERRMRGEPEPEPDVAAPVPEPEAEPEPASEPLPPEALALEDRLRAGGHEPPALAALGDDARWLPALRDAGRVVRVGRTLHVHPDALGSVRERVVALCERDGEVTIATLRDDLGTSRRYAQALLEHFDRERVTLRRGDRHVLRRAR